MDFNDAQTQMAQGSKLKRATWPPERFVVVGDPVSDEDQAALDWVESSFVETAAEQPQEPSIVEQPPEAEATVPPPTPKPLGANMPELHVKEMPELHVKEIKELIVKATAKGQPIDVENIEEVTLSNADADPVYSSDGKEVFVQGVTESAPNTEVIGEIKVLAVIEGKKVILVGKIKPFKVVPAADAVLDEAGNPVLGDDGQPVPALSLEAEVAAA